jgi:hypothetical protein
LVCTSRKIICHGAELLIPQTRHLQIVFLRIELELRHVLGDLPLLTRKVGRLPAQRQHAGQGGQSLFVEVFDA